MPVRLLHVATYPLQALVRPLHVHPASITTVPPRAKWLRCIHYKAASTRSDTDTFFHSPFGLRRFPVWQGCSNLQINGVWQDDGLAQQDGKHHKRNEHNRPTGGCTCKRRQKTMGDLTKRPCHSLVTRTFPCFTILLPKSLIPFRLSCSVVYLPSS